MLIDCSTCKARVDAKILATHNDIEFYGTRTFFLECPVCGSALVAQSYEELAKSPPTWTTPIRVFPRQARELGDDIPPIVRISIDEAEKCMQSGAFLASAAMCGRALEAICRHFKTKDGYLGGGLKELRDKGIIDARIFQWGDELREQRNNAAHATDAELTSQDANDVMSFTYAIIDFIFMLSQKFEKFQVRKAAKVAQKAGKAAEKKA